MASTTFCVTKYNCNFLSVFFDINSLPYYSHNSLQNTAQRRFWCNGTISTGTNDVRVSMSTKSTRGWTLKFLPVQNIEVVTTS